MKLRTNKNAIRFRLNQQELKEFSINGVIQESIRFSPKSTEHLTYSLIQADREDISVSFINNHLRIYIPTAQALKWCSSEDVGFDCHLPIEDDKTLYVLIEKDFKCLTPRDNEDESDNFPNPNLATC